MKHFDIGPGLTCDLERLVVTRLLVQANSGGGKSWLLRRLLEQTAGKVQHIIIDPEGEFSTLREKFDYVLAAPQGGDTAAHPRTAKLLAERVLELNVSVICDIYELDPRDRVLFVKRFLEGLVNAPKHLWHPALVVVDEAHTFCPETGSAESSDAVKALASRGRKRGFCAVLATQRLSKLSKDAAAECNNRLIGRTSLDVDMQRAGDDLGYSKADRLQLRDLDDGEFLAFGPALSKTITRVKVGKVVTTHPEAGGRLALTAPPPSAKVKALLPKLSDLPAEAAEREQSIASLQQEVTRLRRELTTMHTHADEQIKAARSELKTKTVETFVLKDGQLTRAEEIAKKAESASLALSLVAGDIRAAIDRTHPQHTAPAKAELFPPPARAWLDKQKPLPKARMAKAELPTNGDGTLVPARQRILNVLAFFNGIGVDPVDKVQLALFAGVPHTSGGYKNNLGWLRANGYIDYPTPGEVALTEQGMADAQTDGVPTTTERLHEVLRQKLPAPKWAIVERLIEYYPTVISKTDLAALVGVPETSGGYKNNLGSLRTLGLISYPQPGTVKAAPILFLEERH